MCVGIILKYIKQINNTVTIQHIVYLWLEYS